MPDSTRFVEAERQLAEMVRKHPDSPLRARDMEGDLSRFLQLVEESQGERDVFVSLFSEIVRGLRDAPEWLVAYCMHVLRWPEVLVVAEEELRRGHPSTLSVASEVADAYRDDWSGRELFDRFARG
jgi:hypothetical protein